MHDSNAADLRFLSDACFLRQAHTLDECQGCEMQTCHVKPLTALGTTLYAWHIPSYVSLIIEIHQQTIFLSYL